MSTTLKCSTCGKPLEPAILHKDRLWCPICAVEKTLTGQTIEPDPTQTIPQVPPVPAATVQSAKTKKSDSANSLKTFQVTVGDVSFTAYGRVDLLIGATKVSVT